MDVRSNEPKDPKTGKREEESDFTWNSDGSDISVSEYQTK